MYICICSGITDSHLEELVDKHGCKSLEECKQHIDVCSGCMMCEDHCHMVIENKYYNAAEPQC